MSSSAAAAAAAANDKDTTSSMHQDNDVVASVASSSNVADIPEGHTLITEGKINMIYPTTENSVFYNPVQVQNRDLSVLMIGMYAHRRTERLWTIGKKKEVRKRLLLEERERAQNEEKEKKNGESNGGGEKKKKESKEERKAKLAQLELDIETQVEIEKRGVNFIEMTKQQQLSSSSSQTTQSTASSSSATSTTTPSNNNPNNTIHGLTIFEALAASGLRSLRYWTEIHGIHSLTINDLDPVAIDMARENVIRNGLDDDLVNNSNVNTIMDTNKSPDNSSSSFNLRPRGIKLQVGDATHEMYMSRRPPKLYPNQCNATQVNHQHPQFDVIDLDPYGSAAPFMDAAIQSIVHGGLLAITCTDMAALGGSHPETAYGRYGALPIQRSGYLQELALRILLYHVSVVAGRYGRTIKPILSVGMAFYCRVFVEVYDDKAGVSSMYVLDFVLTIKDDYDDGYILHFFGSVYTHVCPPTR